MLASTIQFTNTPRPPERPPRHQRAPAPEPRRTLENTKDTREHNPRPRHRYDGRRPHRPETTSTPHPPLTGGRGADACSLRTQQRADPPPTTTPPAPRRAAHDPRRNGNHEHKGRPRRPPVTRRETPSGQMKQGTACDVSTHEHRAPRVRRGRRPPARHTPTTGGQAR